MRHRLGRSWCYRCAASRGRRGQDPCPAAPAMSARARSERRRPRCRTRSKASFHFCAEKGAISPQSRSTWMGCRHSTAASTRSHARSPPARRSSYGEILGPARRPGLGAGGGSSARAQPIPDHRALPPRARGRWEGGRVLRQWRDHDEAAPAHDRTRAHERYAYVIRWRQCVWLCDAAPAPQLALSAVTEPGLPASARPSI